MFLRTDCDVTEQIGPGKETEEHEFDIVKDAFPENGMFDGKWYIRCPELRMIEIMHFVEIEQHIM